MLARSGVCGRDGLRRDLREVVDPNYVDGAWEYVVRADDDATGWVSRARTRLPSMREEAIDEDP